MKENLIRSFNFNSENINLSKLNSRHLFSVVNVSLDSDVIINVAGDEVLIVKGICSPVCDQIYSEMPNEQVDIESAKENFDCENVCVFVCSPICEGVCDNIW